METLIIDFNATKKWTSLEALLFCILEFLWNHWKRENVHNKNFNTFEELNLNTLDWWLLFGKWTGLVIDGVILDPFARRVSERFFFHPSINVFCHCYFNHTRSLVWLRPWLNWVVFKGQWKHWKTMTFACVLWCGKWRRWHYQWWSHFTQWSVVVVSWTCRNFVEHCYGLKAVSRLLVIFHVLLPTSSS